MKTARDLERRRIVLASAATVYERLFLMLLADAEQELTEPQWQDLRMMLLRRLGEASEQ